MLNLVNTAKEELQRELLQELYKTEVLDELLKESEFTQNRRKECKKMIEALQRADEIVGSGMCYFFSLSGLFLHGGCCMLHDNEQIDGF